MGPRLRRARGSYGLGCNGTLNSFGPAISGGSGGCHCRGLLQATCSGSLALRTIWINYLQSTLVGGGSSRRLFYPSGDRWPVKNLPTAWYIHAGVVPKSMVEGRTLGFGPPHCNRNCPAEQSGGTLAWPCISGHSRKWVTQCHGPTPAVSHLRMIQSLHVSMYRNINNESSVASPAMEERRGVFIKCSSSFLEGLPLCQNVAVQCI